jgi:hypothetical protein
VQLWQQWHKHTPGQACLPTLAAVCPGTHLEAGLLCQQLVGSQLRSLQVHLQLLLSQAQAGASRLRRCQLLLQLAQLRGVLVVRLALGIAHLCTLRLEGTAAMNVLSWWWVVG